MNNVINFDAQVKFFLNTAKSQATHANGIDIVCEKLPYIQVAKYNKRRTLLKQPNNERNFNMYDKLHCDILIIAKIIVRWIWGLMMILPYNCRHQRFKWWWPALNAACYFTRLILFDNIDFFLIVFFLFGCFFVVIAYILWEIPKNGGTPIHTLHFMSIIFCYRANVAKTAKCGNRYTNTTKYRVPKINNNNNNNCQLKRNERERREKKSKQRKIHHMITILLFI